MGKSRLALIFGLLFLLVSRRLTHFSVDKKLYSLCLCTRDEKVLCCPDGLCLDIIRNIWEV